jgi:BlaI family transcriptional regulator, penicillinase repressor
LSCDYNQNNLYNLKISVMKDLTNIEKQIMHILWRLEKGFVNDIIEQIPEPKPEYNTVSTIIRILETKGVFDHKA